MTAARWHMVSTMSRHAFTRRLRAAAFAVAAAVACTAGAASYTNSASGNWTDGGSWSGTAPSAGGAADAAIVFNPSGTAFSTNNLAGSFVLNRLEFASGTVALFGNPLAFTNNGATGPQLNIIGGSAAAIRNSLTLGSDTLFDVANAVTNHGIISGKGGMTKTGAGTLTFATNNTYAGSTTVSAGTLTIATATTVTTIASTNFTIQSGATMRVLTGVPNAWGTPDKAVFNLQSNSTLTIDVPTIHCGVLNAASGATVNGTSGCLSLHATNNAGVITSTLGSLNFKRIILEPYNAANPTQTLQFDGTGTGLWIGTDSGTAFSWRLGSGSSGLCTFNMDVADSPAATVDLTVPFLNLRPGAGGFAFGKQGAGVMQINGLDWASAGTPIKPTTCAVSGGTLVLNTSAVNTFGVNFATLTVDSGATLQVGTNGTTGAIFTNVTDNGTVAFNRSDAYVFTKVISGAGGVVKLGAGTLTLTGVNTYGGVTEVSAGTLLVNAPGSLAAGAVTVTNATLGGNGTINGPVTLAAGGVLAPGGTNTLGTLTLADASAGALTLNGGTLLSDLSTVAGTCDQLPVTGNLVLNGANTVDLVLPGGTVPAGTYTLMTYAAKSGGGSLTLAVAYPNASLDVGATAVTLTVTGSGLTTLKWKGDLSGIWDTSTQNWLNNGVAATYGEGDAVIFDDTAFGNFTISSAGAVSPSTVSFNNSVSNYTLAASMAGAGTPVSKLGSANVTLSGTNTYGGGTTLGAGTLIIGAYTNLPTTGALRFNGGMLRIAGSSITSLAPYAVNWDTFNGGLNIDNGNTITVTNTIGGSGSLAKTGAGALVLSGMNSYSGGTTVNSGYVRASNNSSVGSGAVDMTGANCELDLMGGLEMTNAITVRGVGVVNSAGSLQSFAGTSNTWSGPVTLGENQARIGAIGGSLTVGGVIGSGTNKYDLVVRNPNEAGGTLVLAANNTWGGNTWIRCGTIRLGIDNALPTATVLQLGLNAGQTSVTNAAFDLAGYGQRVAGLLDSGADNAHVVTCSTATFSTLTVSNAATAYTYAGTLDGNLNVVKAGNGTLTLAGTNTTYGGYTVNAGTLAVGTNGTLGVNSTNILVSAGTLALSNSVGIADSATLRIVNGGGAKVNLAAGVNEAVGYLYFGDKQRPGGTYGAAGSGAGVTDNEHFAGSGILTVLHGNGGLIFRLQ